MNSEVFIHEPNPRIHEIMGEINGYKQLLAGTDYKALKFSEGALTEEDYLETRIFRADLREKINTLEAELATLE